MILDNSRGLKVARNAIALPTSSLSTSSVGALVKIVIKIQLERIVCNENPEQGPQRVFVRFQFWVKAILLPTG